MAHASRSCLLVSHTNKCGHAMRQPIWIFLPQNPDEHETLSNFGHVGFRDTSMSKFQSFSNMATLILGDFV